MLCAQNLFFMKLFSADVHGLNGDQILREIEKLASDYYLQDADEVLVEILYNTGKIQTFKYSKESIADFFYLFDRPEDIFENQMIQLGSDVMHEMIDNRKLSKEAFYIDKVTIKGPQLVYDELIQRIEENKTPSPPIEEGPDTPLMSPIPPPIEYDWKPHKRGGMFPFLLSPKYITSQSDEAVFIREEIERCLQGNPTVDWKDLQLLFFENTETITRILSERKTTEEGEIEEIPIQDQCFSVPCILWALKGQITEEEYKELARSQIIFGLKTRIDDITKFLRKWKYNYSISRGHMKNTTRFTKGTNGKTVELAYKEGHWMKKCMFKYKIGGKMRSVKIEVFLQKCLDQGLFRHLSAEELACAYQNFSFSAMKFIQNSIKETIERIPENQLVPFPDNWIQPFSELQFNPNKEFPKTVIFFDFEADTSSQTGHKPFLVSACIARLKDDGSASSIGQIQSFWGKECDKEFMKWVYSQFNVFHESKIRLYAFNARYDLTFVLKWLRNTKICMRKNKFYSIEGYSIFENGQNNSKKGKKLIEIWDAYLLFATSLRNAAKSSSEGGYLTKEQAKDIKKEMFPYNAYTFEYFKQHSGWVDVEDMKVGFMEEDNEGKQFFNQQKYDLFLETLRSTISEEEPWKKYNESSTEPYYESVSYEYRQSSLYRQVKNYSDHDHTPGYRFCTEQLELVEYFDYKKYAIFYCEQDVRCLTQIMLNMEDLCMGRTLEGVVGTPPFKIHIWNHRTASSIGYDNLLMNVFYKYDETSKKWVPRHDFYGLRNEGRQMIQYSIRGGRNMQGQNKQWHFKTESKDPLEMLQDNDANSLYPSAMSKMWVTDGKPHLYKGQFTQEDFKAKFTHPWAPEGKEHEKEFNDGVVHVTYLDTAKKLDIPRICIKNTKGINEWRNFDHETVDTWINAKDLWDLIDHQQATFNWDVAAVYPGERHFEIQQCIKALYDFRQPNKKHAIGNVAKLMMNSSYGKSTMKIVDEEALIIDAVDFPEYFRANAYRIRSFEKWGNDSMPLNNIKYIVKLFKKDISTTNNMFGSNVLSMSKCVMQTLTSTVEDLAEQHGLNPHIYYTDTDSIHVVGKLIEEARPIYKEKYGRELIGKGLCQFHNDFDVPKNFIKEDKEKGVPAEEVLGSNEYWGVGKKAYSDHLIGTMGSEGDHNRLKAIPSECIKVEDYPKLYQGETIHYNILGFGKVSFEYKNGEVLSRKVMTRDISFTSTGEPPTKRQKI